VTFGKRKAGCRRYTFRETVELFLQCNKPAISRAECLSWFRDAPRAICDYAHDRIIELGYHHARGDRTASEGHEERRGVCRDFAHLAVTLSRCMNIPARYCTGYLGDIGVPADPAPMDFSAWYEVFLDGRWFTFDARHNHPRIGRIVIARGRDAADVAISTAFGPAQLARFNVITEELKDVSQDSPLKEAA
jgi:transglutaminase-like putative cysteine protease